MRKTAKESSYKEWLNACPYYENGVYHQYCRNIRAYADSKDKSRKPFCKANCPRMKRWERIQKTIDYEYK